MEYAYKGTPSLADVKHAIDLFLFPIEKQTKTIVGVWVFLIITGILFGIGGISLFLYKNQLCILFLVCAVLYIGLGIKLIKSPKLDYTSAHLSVINQEGIISEEKIFNKTPFGTGEMVWSYFTGYGKGKGVLTLLRGTVAVMIFTREMFSSDEEWNNVNEFVGTKLRKNYDEKDSKTDSINIKTIISILIILGLMAILLLNKQ